MTIAAILALTVVALAAGAYAYLLYSPKPRMPSLDIDTLTIGPQRSLTAEPSIYATAAAASLQELCAVARKYRCVGRLIKCRCTLNVL
jgi:hypothetical protein